ncbi:nicotinamide-nucleotide amidase [Modicisalibacter ilicicola DSM 19980]|uniref:Nicotinamide-nucleotide amidase n=1 Tax=Modicisalibacter ilicicola DSM 19980 TaxID=1121942 RepID=A0A1M4V074_9GAMM|nr:CinA family protein [Halomonas ilicicola]SHE62303.1 nicotinamide-nucleotide amidase [Halomonas ilicicola DSM 19980]
MEHEEELLELSERLGDACRRRTAKVTTAESCTGGGVAVAITDIAGSSDYFETGYVTYADGAKRRLLKVSGSLLGGYGAVSQEAVEAMVKGACLDSGADIGVAVSGIAGPEGGSDEKPVGTVWFAWGDASRQQAERHVFEGDRRAVRRQAVKVALEGLIRWLEK